VCRVPPPNSLEIAAFAVVVGGIVVGARIGWRARAPRWAIAGGAVALALSWLVTSQLAPRWRDDLVVTFLDVGQGDAAVIEAPGGEVWLVDAGGMPFVMDGPDRARRAQLPGELSVLAFLDERRIRHIDLVVLSHPHRGQILGLRAVAPHVSIERVWVAAPHAEVPSSLEYRQLLAGLAAIGTEIIHPPLGMAHRAGGATLEVLAPRYRDSASVDPVMSANDNSLVVRATFGGRRVLFAGDLEEEAEAVLTAVVSDLAADVVKVPHHGSRTSSTERFVAATRPRWAVVSCGLANRFRFPAPEVVARWRRVGARVLRTDRHGAVTVRIARDGAIEVTTMDELR